MNDHFILFSVVFLLIGFLLGQHFRKINNEDKPISFFKQQKKRAKTVDKPTIDIDSTKHVVKIKTDGLEKKYEDMGNKQTTNENITGSINKLKKLKK